MKKNLVKKKDDLILGQQKWIVYALIFLVIAFFIFSSLFSNYGKVNYGGLVFVKEKIGSLVVYKYVKYIYDADRQLVEYDIYFRNNPKTNPVPIVGDKIFYPAGKTTYISVNSTNLGNCSDSQVAMHSLASFLGNHGIKVKSATPIESESNSTSGGYVTCETKPEDPVILVQSGEYTRIVNDDNCHRIYVNNCEIVQAVEKFIAHSLIDARERNPVTKIN